MLRERDIVYEIGKAWVRADRKNNCYTVMIVGITHSTSDSSYSFDADGLSIAKRRAEYLAAK